MSVNLTSIATDAVRILGQLGSGEALSTQQVADALSACNYLIDNWSSEETYILSLLRSIETLSAATQSYTIGTGQTWNLARPVAIKAAAMLNGAGPGFPVEVCSAAKWASIPDRQSQSYVVRHLFYDRGFPNGNVLVSPVPLGSGLTMEILTWVPLTQFADATTPITLLPGYARFLELGLAIELAPQYNKAPSDVLLKNYAAAEAIVKGLNAQAMVAG